MLLLPLLLSLLFVASAITAVAACISDTCVSCPSPLFWLKSLLLTMKLMMVVLVLVLMTALLLLWLMTLKLLLLTLLFLAFSMLLLLLAFCILILLPLLVCCDYCLCCCY